MKAKRAVRPAKLLVQPPPPLPAGASPTTSSVSSSLTASDASSSVAVAAVRPTSDRTRESLFNRLAHGGHGPGGASPLPGASVLDAFCGTGALGLEAISRGASTAAFLDSRADVLACARANAAALDVTGQCSFTQADATRPPAAQQAASLAFLDPPYQSGLAQLALAALAAAGWLAAEALVCLELAADEDLVPLDGFETLDSRKTGAARVILMRFAG